MSRPSSRLTLPDNELSRRERLRSILVSAVEESAFLPFDRFMEIVLYTPGLGYYDHARSPLGTDGDYYTAVHVDPLFARVIAHHFAPIFASLPDGRPKRLVELGAGDGTLARELLSTFSSLGADQRPTEYVAVERSAARRETLARDLGPSIRTTEFELRVSESLANDGPFGGVVIANEFLDAQPTRRLHFGGGEWREVGLRVANGKLRWGEEPVRRPIPGQPLPSPEEESYFEISPEAEATFREVADHLLQGRALFLDYGFEESELLTAHPQGTLGAVAGHRMESDPLESPGGADVSFFVNFTRARAAARLAGLAEHRYAPQRDLLAEWGIESLLGDVLLPLSTEEERVRRRLAVKKLLFDFGTFWGLEVGPSRTAT